VPIENDHAADLTVLHRQCCLADIFVVEAVDDTLAHDLSNPGRSWIGALRRGPYSNVSVCHHTHEAPIVAYRQRPHVKVLHQFGRFLNCHFRAYTMHALSHHFLNKHRLVSFMAQHLAGKGPIWVTLDDLAARSSMS